MSRRRMMMLQQGKPDLLEGYRIDNKSAYTLHAVWLDNNNVRLSHLTGSFAGPNAAAVNFIGVTKAASTAYNYVLSSQPLSTLEVSKTYKLILTVTEITENTATAENDGTLSIVFGRSGGTSELHISKADIKFSELAVGNRFELIKTYEDGYYVINGAAFQATNASIQFDIKFKVEFEEV